MSKWNKTNHKKKSNNNQSKVSKGQHQDRKMMHDAQTPNNRYTHRKWEYKVEIKLFFTVLKALATIIIVLGAVCKPIKCSSRIKWNVDSSGWYVARDDKQYLMLEKKSIFFHLSFYFFGDFISICIMVFWSELQVRFCIRAKIFTVCDSKD